jgi:hypothetical protein
LFTLYNPTTAPGGIATSDVLFADAMEWDYSGEYIMYDALNRIEGNFGDGIEYWDIGFLQAWDNSSEDFAFGQIGKLFSALPENISVGNPSFAKNSPYIITFDFVESYYDIFGSPAVDYWVIAANIEAGIVNNIYQNTTVGYPSYSRLDDQILFTYDDFGDLLLATIDVQANDKTLPVQGTDVVLINGAQKGVWFNVGQREFTSLQNIPVFDDMLVRPQPVSDVLYLDSPVLGDKVAYRIFDLSGQRVGEDEVLTSQAIDVGHLPAGHYYMQLITGSQEVVNARFVKQY